MVRLGLSVTHFAQRQATGTGKTSRTISTTTFNTYINAPPIPLLLPPHIIVGGAYHHPSNLRFKMRSYGICFSPTRRPISLYTSGAPRAYYSGTITPSIATLAVMLFRYTRTVLVMSGNRGLWQSRVVYSVVLIAAPEGSCSYVLGSRARNATAS